MWKKELKKRRKIQYMNIHLCGRMFATNNKKKDIAQHNTHTIHNQQLHYTAHIHFTPNDKRK